MKERNRLAIGLFVERDFSGSRERRRMGRGEEQEGTKGA